MRKTLSALLIVLISFWSGVAHAERYSVTVSRQDSNIYEIKRSDILIVTKRCRVRARRDEAIIDTNSREVYFIDDEESCRIDYFLVPANLDQGRYEVTVTHEDDNMYSTLSYNMYIKTKICYEYEYFEEAIIDVNSFGYGIIFFLNSGASCDIEEIYVKKRRL